VLIVMAGASGFLGQHLARRLSTDGHRIVRLVRRQPAGNDERQWSPERHELDPAHLAGADAVVNLAGTGAADHRWTKAYRAAIRSSRVDSTATLAEAVAGLSANERPATLVNSSAVGFYGDTGETAVDEGSPPGSGFFPDVCQAWEAATRAAENAGVRVVLLRTGLVMHASGGMLKPLVLAFRLGLGGRFGSGRQWMPCTSLADWLDAAVFLLSRTDLAGPVNMVGPNPVRNAEFAKALGAALHRPAVWPIPALALRIAVGGFGAEAVASQRILPGVLTRAGFPFQHPTVDKILATALSR
jgi:uncharacterized protein